MAFGDNGQDELVRFCRVEAVEPEPSNVLGELWQSCEDAVRVLERSIRVTVDGLARGLVNEFVEAHLAAVVG